MKYWKTPTPEQLSKAIAQIAHFEHRKYFFGKLDNPEWVEPLSKKNVFSTPPQAIRDETRGTIVFPPWPEGEYLGRMAKSKPDLVCQIILKIQTDNFWAHESFIDAALAMSGKLAAQIGEKEIVWIKQLQYLYRLLPDKLGLLIAHLAQQAECDTALELTAILLKPQAHTPKANNEDNIFHHQEAIARFETWDYGQIIEKNIPDVAKSCGSRVIELLCQLLVQAIRLEQTEERKGSDDYSYIWRESVSEKPSHDSVKNILVSAVRDAAIEQVKTSKDATTLLIELLERQPFKIFQRLALDLLQHSPVQSLIEERLSNKTLFEDIAIRHEYIGLLKKEYPSISAEAKQTILAWIEAGPKARVPRVGRDLTEEENKAYIGRWQRDWLAHIVDSTSAEHQARFTTLVKELGSPADLAGFRGGVTSWVGPESPLSEQELCAMPIAALIDYLKTWVATPSMHMGPSPEGLGRQLAEIVAKNPGPYALAAKDFIGTDPTYIRSLIQGLEKALNEKQSFDWAPVLNLCDWVIKQPITIVGRVKSQDTDPSWEWARKGIGRLLDVGVTAEQNQIPISSRETVWTIIEVLTSDPDPTPQTDAEYARLGSDPATLSINSTRGEALTAMVQYGLWVRRHLEKQLSKDDLAQKGFSLMPEVQKVLELHLDATIETSPSVRTVYARWFPWLVLLDKKWSSDHIGVIFPADDEKRGLWDVAWGTYVTFCQAYDEPFVILRQEYRRALDRIGSVPQLKHAQKDADERIAEHLMELYWRGRLSLNPPDELLELLWSKAPPIIKARAIGFVGFSLHNTKDEVPKGILKRLQELWEYRMLKLKDVAADSESTKELEEFGWWVARGKFEPAWALSQLEIVLKISGGRIEIGHLIMERLANYATNHTATALHCAEMMIKGEKKGWGVLSWRDSLKVILQVAGASANANIRRSAGDIIHLLGRLGHSGFREILPKDA